MLTLLRKYVVHASPDMSDEATMFMLDVPHLRAVILHLFGCGIDEDSRAEEMAQYAYKSEEELVNEFNESNGDGQPYYMVMDVETRQVVLGGKGLSETTNYWLHGD